MAKTKAFHLTLFGGFSLVDSDGNAIDLGPRKVKAMFAWLACNPDVEHPREKVASILWPDSQEEVARHSLRQALASMRKVLPAENSPLKTSRDSILLDSALLWVDALEFEAVIARGEVRSAEQIANLYKGEFLASCNPRSELFDDWLEEHRHHYKERATAGLCQYLSQLLDQKAYQSAVPFAARLITIDPLRESAYRSMITAQMGQGNNALALRWYRRCERVLMSELGVRPCLETRALHAQLLATMRGDSNNSRETAGEVQRFRRASQMRSNDRQRVLNQVEFALQTIADHLGGQTILLRGESPRAMERLVEQVTELARLQGFEVCRGQFTISDATKVVSGERPRGHCEIAASGEKAALVKQPEEQLNSCVACVAADRKRHPVLLILENIHALGSHMLEKIGKLISSAGQAPVLLLMTTQFGGESTEQAWQGAMVNAPLTTIDLPAKM